MSSEKITRRQQFCQIQSEITGSDQYLVVGIDVAKDTHHAFMGTAAGKTLCKKLIFENNLAGFSKLLQAAEATRVQNALCKVIFGLEPTGNYHKPLGNYLIQSGCHVVLVSGKAVKDNRRLLDGRWDKNDNKDAANIADLVSRGRFLFYDVCCVQIEQLRDLMSLRRRLKKEQHSIRMRIRNNVLAKYFPELDCFYSGCEKESLAIVHWCLDPKKIAGLDFDQFFSMVTRSKRGIAQRLRLQKIHRIAAQSVGCRVRGAAEFEAALLVQKLKEVGKQIRQVKDLIEQIAADFETYHILLTIPGFGPYVAAVVLAAIGDPLRFESSHQVVKLAGYDLCANRSGKKSEDAVPVISKNGNGELRYALYQAAFIASVRNAHFVAYFTHMLRGRQREHGIRTKMRVKLAAKMLIIAWTLMKKKEAFNPDYLNIP